MKNKVVKIVLIIILAILAIILVNFMIYAIINRNNDYSIKFSLIAFGNNTEKIYEKEYEPEELDKIDVDVSSSNVFIEKANVDKIKIFLFAMLYWCDEKIIIQVPNDCDEKFDIHTSSGDIVAPNLENNVINFESSSGKIECGNIDNGNFKSSSGDIIVGNGNEITLQTSSGSIKAGNYNELSAETSSGDVEVGNIGEGTIKTSSGKILVNEAKRLQAEASSGNIDISKINEYCNLKTSSGGIDIDSLNLAENSFINAKSGSVDIRIKNDIYIETETKLGDVDLKNNNRMAKIVLKITTTSGSIKVD